MGVSTHGFLKIGVTGRDIYNVISSKFDKDAVFDIKFEEIWNSEGGYIRFKYNNEERQLFYCITEDNEEDTEFEDGEKHVCLILGKWGSSVEIMTEIIKCFGGYIDENDCDDINAYYIHKDSVFDYSEYTIKRDKIIEVLDGNLNFNDKNKIASQILKHKEKILELL